MRAPEIPGAPATFERARRHFMAGLDHQLNGRLAEAEGEYRAALALAPDRLSVLNNLAAVLIEQARAGEAEAVCARALAVAPDDFTAHLNDGVRLDAIGKSDEALARLERAIGLAPDRAEAHAARADVLAALGQTDAALVDYDRAIALAPGNTGVRVNRAIALREARRHAEALSALDAALLVDPASAKLHFSRANVLVDLGRPEEALAAYDRAEAIAPDLDYLPGHSMRCALMLGRWADLEGKARGLEAAVLAGRAAAEPFELLSVADSPEIQLACARQFVRRSVPDPSRPRPPTRRAADGRVRIAYVSADIRRHPVAEQLVGVIESHDRARFEVTVVSVGPTEIRAGEAAARIHRAADRFMEASRWSDAQVAEALSAARVDIAIDLNGHTELSRPGIFALRPAPAQVAYLGFAATSGAPWIDAMIADDFVIPEHEAANYSERIIRIPGTYFPFDPRKTAAPLTPTRAELGLPQEGFVFCCFNAAPKITPPVFRLWMRILAAVPGSVLWLGRHTEGFVERSRRYAAECGVDPGRIRFAGFVESKAEHLARYRAADLFLDTFPYTAHTTGADALSTGLPLLTRAGRSFVSRVSGSMLMALGLDALVVTTEAEYEAAAVALAGDAGRLDGLQRRLASAEALGLFRDVAGYTRRLEQALERAARLFPS